MSGHVEDEGSRWDAPPYETNRVLRIPDAIPELGVEAGERGVILHVWADGRIVDVEIPKDGGTSTGFANVEVLDDGSLRVVGHSRLGA